MQTLQAALQRSETACAEAAKRASDLEASAARSVWANTALAKEVRAAGKAACVTRCICLTQAVPVSLQRERSAALSARVSELERAASRAGELAARIAVLERSLAAVREAALGAGALGGAPVGNGVFGEQAAAMQSALSGHAPAVAANEDVPPLSAPPAPRPAPEVVVESRAQTTCKRARAADADGRRRNAAQRDAIPEPLHCRLPSPVSPLLPRRRDMHLPPPLSPLERVQQDDVLEAVIAEGEPPAKRAAVKRSVGRPRKTPGAAATRTPAQTAAAPADAGEVALGRAAAVPLRGRPALPPPALADAALPAMQYGAPADVEAAAQRATSEAAVRAVLLHAAEPDAASHALDAVARGLCASAMTRALSPPALLHGVVAALRAEGVDVLLHERLALAVLALDATLTAAHDARSGARATGVRLLGSGVPGGFADAVLAELQQAALEATASNTPSVAGAHATACGTFALLHARQQTARARVLLLDLLTLGAAAGGARSMLTALVRGAFSAWSELFTQLPAADPLAAAVAATVRPLLESTSEAMPSVDFDAAAECALAALSACADGSRGPDVLHSAARGLELLARHCGWPWAVQRVIQPHLGPMMSRENNPTSASTAARALTCLLLAAGCESDAYGPAEARLMLTACLAETRYDAASCAAAEGVAELHARSGLAQTQEGAALGAWWASLRAEQQQAVPARIARALRAVGLHSRAS